MAAGSCCHRCGTLTMSAEEQKEAMDILDRMREKIEKEEAEKAKLIAEAKELGMSLFRFEKALDAIVKRKIINVNDLLSFDSSEIKDYQKLTKDTQ